MSYSRVLCALHVRCAEGAAVTHLAELVRGNFMARN